MHLLFLFLLAVVALPATAAETFHLPTANGALYENLGGERYFVGTVGHDWKSGMFGCVRSAGWQMHEGIDVKCLQRDSHGEPTDDVLATADGTVVYTNTKPALSNYGNYLILRHNIDGIEIYSIYAHLHEIRAGLKAGAHVKYGEPIAIMGRTTNTREGISKERAHVHFEFDLFANDHFAEWYKKTLPGQRNDHGQFNGQNFLGLDPTEILREQKVKGAKFNLRDYIVGQKEICRVLVKDTNFPWLKRYAPLVDANPVAKKEGVAGYEIFLNFNGVPFRLIPRAASEIKGKSRYQLLSVNEPLEQEHPCRKLVTHKSGKWELANNGLRLLELLTE